MKFGDISLEHAVGAILAHRHHLSGQVFKKGRVLSDDDVTALRRAGFDTVIAAVLEDNDVPEDEAAEQLSHAISGDGVSPTAPFTGRCNVIAESDGLLLIDSVKLDELNLIDEAITIATLPPFTVVSAGQMVATVKIIPFAAPQDALVRCLAIVSGGSALVQSRPFRARRVGLVQTRLSGTKEKVLDKTSAILETRLVRLGANLEEEIRTAHRDDEIATAIGKLIADGSELVLVSGGSAIVDRRDVVPAAVTRAGGSIDHFGMPVDPGNLLLLAHCGSIPVLGLPGCARSPKFNGLDMVLERIAADIPISREDIMRMGAGGLLKEMANRPQPREDRPPRAPAALPKLAAIILAAGQSRRMGAANKLLAEIDGVPMIARVVDAALASRASPVVVVLGHEAGLVREALAGRSVEFVVNPAYAEGLSTSLRAGLGALAEETKAALICLGDMPRLSGKVLDRLIAAYDPIEGRAICVPTRRGKRGNPVLWDHRFFSDMKVLSGDVGARHLIGDNADVVVEVEMEDDSVLIDVDSPAALTALKEKVNPTGRRQKS